jgi:hypothetical protein
VLQRRVSLTLIGIPLATAVKAIADRAGLELAFNAEAIPSGARVSMKADDITVGAAVRRRLERLLGASAESWLNLQLAWDLYRAQRAPAAQQIQNIQPAVTIGPDNSDEPWRG